MHPSSVATRRTPTRRVLQEGPWLNGGGSAAGVTIDDAIEARQVVLMHPSQNGLLSAADVGCPVGSVGLLRGDHVERQETLATAWMLGIDRQASQVSRGVALGVQIGSNHCWLRFGGGKRHAIDGSTTRRLSINRFLGLNRNLH